MVNWSEEGIAIDEFQRIISLAKKSILDEDITFDIGFKYFRGNKIFVEEKVFVPQYDTEQIVDFLSKFNNKKTLLEVGTGTGAISIASKKEHKFDVTAIDINNNALKLAKRNADFNKVNINFINQNIFEYAPKEKFDILISNPPYIDINDSNVEKWVEDNQPHEALYADLDGYAFYKWLILNHDLYLESGGIMIFEIGYNQAKTIKLLVNQINYKSFSVYKDIESKFDRFVVIEL